MNGETFKAYVEQFLAPTLKRGDIVFMDNVSVHKVDGVEQAIEARGAIPFYLPAYSPDLNPIEQLSLLWEILSGAGFPNQFFNDSWVVGFWRADHGRQDAGLERRAWTLAQAVSGSVGS
jgi:hypothetical protein